MSKFIRDNQLDNYNKDEEKMIRQNKQKKMKRFKDFEESKNKINKRD